MILMILTKRKKIQLNFLNNFWEINIIVLFFVIKYFEVLKFLKLFFS